MYNDGGLEGSSCFLQALRSPKAGSRGFWQGIDDCLLWLFFFVLILFERMVPRAILVLGKTCRRWRFEPGTYCSKTVLLIMVKADRFLPCIAFTVQFPRFRIAECEVPKLQGRVSYPSRIKRHSAAKAAPLSTAVFARDFV